MQNGIEKANKTVIGLKGRIDSNNAAQVEDDIMARLGSDAAVVLDAAALDYISSAGLRVILRVKKSHPDVSIINANPEVYDIMDITGFTEM
ncbi:MAG: STAS domain-containing protein, partial [Clostridia bacterium]|nr:STAS domain-containing protein [Clostridia bacterium]